MVQTSNTENGNILNYIPTVGLVHVMGTVASSWLRERGEIGCLGHEVIHSSNLRQEVEKTIGLVSVGVFCSAIGYYGVSALFKN